MFPPLVAAEHQENYQRSFIASGVESLDPLLGGGIERGTSTLLIGPPGSGNHRLRFSIRLPRRLVATMRQRSSSTKPKVLCSPGRRDSDCKSLKAPVRVSS